MKSILIIILLILVCVANCFSQAESVVGEIIDARNFQSEIYYIDYSYDASLDHYNIGVHYSETGFIDCENFHGKELKFDENRNIYYIDKGSFIFYFDHNKKLGQVHVRFDHYRRTDLFVINLDYDVR